MACKDGLVQWEVESCCLVIVCKILAGGQLRPPDWLSRLGTGFNAKFDPPAMNRGVCATCEAGPRAGNRDVTGWRLRFYK